jgi:hypothetical protein
VDAQTVAMFGPARASEACPLLGRAAVGEEVDVVAERRDSVGVERLVAVKERENRAVAGHVGDFVVMD